MKNWRWRCSPSTGSLLRPTISKYGGIEVKTIGDAFLLEFPSTLEAVRCALDIQRLLYERRIVYLQFVQLRIGIHVGDVIHTENDIYGDAVNIASRIEPLAEPGGVCLTQQVYEHVRNKIDCPIMSLGRLELKNIELPMEVYKLFLLGARRQHRSITRWIESA